MAPPRTNPLVEQGYGSEDAEDIPMPAEPIRGPFSAPASAAQQTIEQRLATAYARRTAPSTSKKTSFVRDPSPPAVIPTRYGTRSAANPNQASNATPPLVLGPFTSPTAAELASIFPAPVLSTARASSTTPALRSRTQTPLPATADLVDLVSPPRSASQAPPVAAPAPVAKPTLAAASAIPVLRGKHPINKTAPGVRPATAPARQPSESASDPDKSGSDAAETAQPRGKGKPRKRVVTRKTRIQYPSDPLDTDTDPPTPTPPDAWNREEMPQERFMRYVRFTISDVMRPPLDWETYHQFAFVIHNNGGTISYVSGDGYCLFRALFAMTHIRLPKSTHKCIPLLKALREFLLPYAQLLCADRDLTEDTYGCEEYLHAFAYLVRCIILVGPDSSPEPPPYLLQPPSAQADEPRWSTTAGTRIITPLLDTLFYDNMDLHTSQRQVKQLMIAQRPVGRPLFPIISTYQYMGDADSNSAHYWPVTRPNYVTLDTPTIDSMLADPSYILKIMWALLHRPPTAPTHGPCVDYVNDALASIRVEDDRFHRCPTLADFKEYIATRSKPTAPAASTTPSAPVAPQIPAASLAPPIPPPQATAQPAPAQEPLPEPNAWTPSAPILPPPVRMPSLADQPIGLTREPPTSQPSPRVSYDNTPASQANEVYGVRGHYSPAGLSPPLLFSPVPTPTTTVSTQPLFSPPLDPSDPIDRLASPPPTMYSSTPYTQGPHIPFRGTNHYYPTPGPVQMADLSAPNPAPAGHPHAYNPYASRAPYRYAQGPVANPSGTDPATSRPTREIYRDSVSRVATRAVNTHTVITDDGNRPRLHRLTYAAVTEFLSRLDTMYAKSSNHVVHIIEMIAPAQVAFLQGIWDEIADSYIGQLMPYDAWIMLDRTQYIIMLDTFKQFYTLHFQEQLYTQHSQVNARILKSESHFDSHVSAIYEHIHSSGAMFPDIQAEMKFFLNSLKQNNKPFVDNVKLWFDSFGYQQPYFKKLYQYISAIRNRFRSFLAAQHYKGDYSTDTSPEQYSKKKDKRTRSPTPFQVKDGSSSRRDRSRSRDRDRSRSRDSRDRSPQQNNNNKPFNGNKGYQNNNKKNNYYNNNYNQQPHQNGYNNNSNNYSDHQQKNNSNSNSNNSNNTNYNTQYNSSPYNNDHNNHSSNDSDRRSKSPARSSDSSGGQRSRSNSTDANRKHSHSKSPSRGPPQKKPHKA